MAPSSGGRRLVAVAARPVGYRGSLAAGHRPPLEGLGVRPASVAVFARDGQRGLPRRLPHASARRCPPRGWAMARTRTGTGENSGAIRMAAMGVAPCGHPSRSDVRTSQPHAIPHGVSVGPGVRPVRSPASHDSYLVDSASSHMLVSKIKPCEWRGSTPRSTIAADGSPGMSKYKHLIP